MNRLIVFSVQEYMSCAPETEHRWMDPANAASFVEHMNRTWSGGRYSSSFRVLSKEEALAFAQSDDCDPGSREWLIEQIALAY